MVNYLLSDLKRYLLSRSGNIILTRTACLGNDVIKRLELKALSINSQKGRVDGLISGPNLTFRSFLRVKRCIKRKDIKYIINQQRFSWFPRKNPLLIIMDSYSELTDQKFVMRTGEYFFANFSDVDKVQWRSRGECLGLLNEKDIQENYNIFFTKIQKLYPEVLVVFIHFPSELENRELFIDRARLIKECIEYQASKMDNLLNISVDSGLVLHSEFDEYPYHYCEDVYENIADQIKRSAIFKEKVLLKYYNSVK